VNKNGAIKIRAIASDTWHYKDGVLAKYRSIFDLEQMPCPEMGGLS
jgi:hypothetical protein